MVSVLWWLWLLGATYGSSFKPPSLEGWQDGSDLESFVSRPDIRAPRMLVLNHRPELIEPGHLFLTPYSHVADQAKTERREFYPCQTGAHIYDQNGNLVWSGACFGGNRNIFGGFAPFTVDGQQYLSMIFPPRVFGEGITEAEKVRSCVILNNRYEEVSRTTLPEGHTALDFHELNVLPGGKTALVITFTTFDKDATELDQAKRAIIEGGFQEIELGSGRSLFSWIPTDHGVLLNETFDVQGIKSTKHNDPWDYMHVNAIDKSSTGNYFVSGRHANTIYCVSGSTGQILWRLGGHNSDFIMEAGVEFFWQHHVKCHFQNETTTILSLFDNSAEDADRNPDFQATPASGKVILLDTSSRPMRARLLRKVPRPMGTGLTPKLGSMQILGTDAERDHLFIDWAMQGYVSEHDAQGDCIMEARFQSPRMNSYRAFKHPFIGMPVESPVLRIIPTSTEHQNYASTFYVSWNGATEVHRWNFYAAREPGHFHKVGSADRTGFETSWTMPGLVRYAYAEAIHKNGTVLRHSATFTIDPPGDEEFRTFSALLDSPAARTALFAPQGAFSTSIGRMAWLGVYSLAVWGGFCTMRSVAFRWAPGALRERRGYRPLD